MAKYLDFDGVKYLWGKIKANFAPISHVSIIASYNNLGHIKTAKSYTGAVSGYTPAQGTTAPTVNAITNMAGKYYFVEIDSSGVPFVNVPWADTKVTQSPTTENAVLPLLLNNGGSTTNSVKYNSGIAVNPSEGDIYLGYTNPSSLANTYTHGVYVNPSATSNLAGIEWSKSPQVGEGGGSTTTYSAKILGGGGTYLSISNSGLVFGDGSNTSKIYHAGNTNKLTSTINGTTYTSLTDGDTKSFTIYAPTTAGSNGQILMSNGSGVPKWGTLSGSLPNAGSATKPIYIAEGTPKSCSDTLDVNISKNAATASKFQNARKLTIGNKEKTFDGSADVSWSLEEIGVTALIDSKIAVADALIFKGVVNASNNLPVKGYNTGWTYKVAVAGTYAGQVCEVGDMIIAVNSRPSGDAATTVTSGDWTVIQNNVDVAGSNKLGLVKSGSSVSNASGYTPAPIISGVPYYKDTNTSHTHSVGDGLTITGAGGTSGDTKYTLKVSSATEIGGIKTERAFQNTTASLSNLIPIDIPTSISLPEVSTTANRYYPVCTDKTGIAFVNVPWSDADTKNTAGSTQSNSKLLLVGATSQAASGVTYSKSVVYADTDNRLYCASGANSTTSYAVLTVNDVLSTSEIDAAIAAAV